jgi:hypothetical protein
MRVRYLVAATWAALVSGPAWAATITPGFTFAVASAGGSTASGTHYHSNTGGSFGNPAGKAEVGGLGGEGVRGLSEYNLTALTLAPSAFVTFDVFRLGGLFGQSAYQGNITVTAYQGNNLENISDYQATSVGTVGTFSTVGLTTGDVLSFDITSIFNAAVTANWSSLGIRLAVGNDG